MTLRDYQNQSLDLSDLCSAAGELLKRAPKPADKRVNPLPDPRTVRYYQSADLVDRPSYYRGRKAVYGYRQLLQTCTVKLLQGAGRSLAEIQRGLAGQSTAQLEAVLAPALGLALVAPVEHPDDPPGALSIGLPTPVPPALPVVRPWKSVELMPGVLVNIDPALHPQPELLIARLHAALHTPQESE